MIGEIKKIKRNIVKTMVVRTRCSVQDLPTVIGESYGKVMAVMNQNGAIPAGAPYVAYFNQDMNDLKVEIGIPTASYMPDTEDVVMSEIPAGEYISVLYTGPYSGIGGAYEKMMAYMAENQVEMKGAAYESYLNDPEDTPDDQLMTEILLGI